jgi:hypothetical protein
VGNALEVTNSNIAGTVNLGRSSFSELSIAENAISGTLEIGASQARCVYDIRKNRLDDLIVIDAGFGSLNLEDQFWSANPKDLFDFRRLPYEEFSPEPHQLIVRALAATRDCKMQNFVRPGTFVVIDNRINFSLCMRKLHWLRGAESNFYLSENRIDGAAWFDFATSGSANERHVLGMFNVRVGTMFFNFENGLRDVYLRMNGLHFDRTYISQDTCESALALRSVATATSATVSFPPSLKLPEPDQAMSFIGANKFSGTQPFAQFVNAY